MPRKATPKKEPEVAAPKRRVGRPKGVTAKVANRTKTLREIAGTYAEEAVNVLARIAMDDEAPHSARVSASNSLLDRAFGRPAQAEPTPEDSADKAVKAIKVEFVAPPKPKPVQKKVKAGAEKA